MQDLGVLSYRFGRQQGRDILRHATPASPNRISLSYGIHLNPQV